MTKRSHRLLLFGSLLALIVSVLLGVVCVRFRSPAKASADLPTGGYTPPTLNRVNPYSDVSAYPSANLFSLSNYTSHGSLVSYSLDPLTGAKNITFFLSRSVSPSSVTPTFVFSVNVILGETYTFSGCVSSSHPSNSSGLFLSSVEHVDKSDYGKIPMDGTPRSVTFVATSDCLYIHAYLFYASPSSSADINVFLTDCRLNVGSTPYPYIPRLASVYSEGYNLGTEDGTYGLNKAVSDAYDDGYDTGYDTGYDKGVSDAYNKQAEAGTLKDGITSFLYSLFDAPVNAFMGVFDVTVDGFDFGALIAFIASIMILVFLGRLFL